MKREPLFTCDIDECAAECSYPADMLRIHEGKVICEGCWDEMPAIWKDGDGGDSGGDYLHWSELEPLVPDDKRRIAELEARIEHLMVLLYQSDGRDGQYYKAAMLDEKPRA